MLHIHSDLLAWVRRSDASDACFNLFQTFMFVKGDWWDANWTTWIDCTQLNANTSTVSVDINTEVNLLLRRG
jgi:hypothetical protein